VAIPVTSSDKCKEVVVGDGKRKKDMHEVFAYISIIGEG